MPGYQVRSFGRSIPVGTTLSLVAALGLMVACSGGGSGDGGNAGAGFTGAPPPDLGDTLPAPAALLSSPANSGGVPAVSGSGQYDWTSQQLSNFANSVRVATRTVLPGGSQKYVGQLNVELLNPGDRNAEAQDMTLPFTVYQSPSGNASIGMYTATYGEGADSVGYLFLDHGGESGYPQATHDSANEKRPYDLSGAPSGVATYRGFHGFGGVNTDLRRKTTGASKSARQEFAATGSFEMTIDYSNQGSYSDDEYYMRKISSFSATASTSGKNARNVKVGLYDAFVFGDLAIDLRDGTIEGAVKLSGSYFDDPSGNSAEHVAVLLGNVRGEDGEGISGIYTHFPSSALDYVQRNPDWAANVPAGMTSDEYLTSLGYAVDPDITGAIAGDKLGGK